MADAHFDRELQLFLRDLEEIQPFYTESIKDAKDQLVETFFDHLMHYEYQYEDSPEIQAQRRAHLLRVMAERDFPHYESYFQGRVQVSNVL